MKKRFIRLTIVSTIVFLFALVFYPQTANADKEPNPGNRYMAVGEDGAILCFCDSEGTKCVCM